IAVGDAYSDRAPVQIGQWEGSAKIDAEFRKIFMEKGGGGTGRESYELIAWYLAHRTEMDCLKRGKKGYLHMLVDERPYETVSAAQVKTIMGVDLPNDIPTRDVFEALKQKFHLFVHFPRATVQERKNSINAEIRRRLIEAHGQFENVDIRCSLMW